MPNSKRALTQREVSEMSILMDSAPMGHKPTVRQFAKRYGVNQPTILKALGGWKGIERNRPQPQIAKRVPFESEIIEGGGVASIEDEN
jgi:hypothetical protein